MGAYGAAAQARLSHRRSNSGKHATLHHSAVNHQLHIVAPAYTHNYRLRIPHRRPTTLHSQARRTPKPILLASTRNQS